MISIAELNVLPREEFAEGLRPLFEAAAPLADALFSARPFASYSELLDAAERRLQSLPRAAQVEVVNAHPRIGENATVVRGTSERSYREQGYDAEAALPAAEVAATYDQLRELNAEYERTFGFRFVVFVNGRPKSAIVEVMRQRLQRSAEDELNTAMHDMLAIAHARLAAER